MNNRIFFHSPIRYIVGFVIATTITILYLFTTSFNYVRCYADGFFTGGCVTVLFGLLALVAYLGAFDMFSYGFLRISGRARDKYHDLVEYEESKKEKRSKNKFIFMPYLVVGVFFILISVILFIIA